MPRVAQLHRLQQKREALLVALEQAQRRGDLARVADIKYGSMQDVEERLKTLRAQAPKAAMLTEEVRFCCCEVYVTWYHSTL